MSNQIKMDREQFEALMNMLEAIFCVTVGWNPQARESRSRALDYLGKERGIAKSYIKEEPSA